MFSGPVEGRHQWLGSHAVEVQLSALSVGANSGDARAHWEVNSMTFPLAGWRAQTQRQASTARAEQEQATSRHRADESRAERLNTMPELHSCLLWPVCC